MAREKRVKTRTWLLYVFVAVLVLSVGALTYKLIKAVIGENVPSGEIVNYNDKETGSSVVIEDSDYYAAIERQNRFNDFWVGSESGGVVKWVMDDVATHNKKYPDEPIQLVFGNINCGKNTNCIVEQKKKLNDMNEYEISYEYNDDGDVYMVRIGSGPVNYFLLIPLGMVAVVVIFTVCGFVRTLKMRKKITKNIMEIVEENRDGFRN